MCIKKLYYFSGTHWDREWYQTFQGFRFRLERTLREMIEYLEKSPDFEVFYFDGQTIVFEDFLEVAPECRERLTALFRQGKIRIGPWYTMPDELLVSGEAIIRNLQQGLQLCRKFGTESWNVGYICDIFGHIAQLPQIFAGFDIHTAVLGRGTNEDTTPMFFRWMSPDGTACTAYKVPNYLGYGSFALEVAGSRAQGVERDPESREFIDLARRYVDREMARSNTDAAVIMDAADHEAIHQNTPAYIRKLREMYPDVEVVHGDIEGCFARAAAFALPEKRGELIETSSYPAPYHNLLTNTLSSRVDIKRRNDRCQSLLEQWMEPLTVYLRAVGTPVSREYLHIAWINLLRNQPHDSICGCSVDRVHEEMGYRFSQVESLSEALTQEPLLQRLGSFRCICGGEVLNLLYMGTEAADRTVTVDIPFDRDFPVFQEGFGYEPVHAFRLYDAQGAEIPYRIEKIRNNATQRICSELTRLVDLYTVTFRTRLNPFGVTPVRVEAQKMPVRFGGKTAGYDGNLENEFLRVVVESDGRLTLYDKRTGRTYSNLLGLLSDSEIGDGWWSVRNRCSELSAKTRMEEVSILTNNETGASVRIVRTLQVPERVEQTTGGLVQSAHKVLLPVETVVTLNAGEDFLRVDMMVQNQAKDHRLRLHIPTDTASDTYYASQAFAMVCRKAGVETNTLWFKEPEQLEKNTDGILLRMDNKGEGLAFISAYGIHEGGGDNDPRASLLVTLLRSFYRTHTKNNESGGEIQGMHPYRFALKPLAGDSWNSLLKRRDMLRTQVFAFAAPAEMAFAHSMVEVSGNCVVSCLKPMETGSGAVLRLYNAQQTPQTVQIKLSPPFAALCPMNLMEEQTGPAQASELSAEVPPGKIVTLGLLTSL